MIIWKTFEDNQTKPAALWALQVLQRHKIAQHILFSFSNIFLLPSERLNQNCWNSNVWNRPPNATQAARYCLRVTIPLAFFHLHLGRVFLMYTPLKLDSPNFEAKYFKSMLLSMCPGMEIILTHLSLPLLFPQMIFNLQSEIFTTLPITFLVTNKTTHSIYVKIGFWQVHLSSLHSF